MIWYPSLNIIMNYYNKTNKICRLVDETHEWSSTILVPDGDKSFDIFSTATVRHQLLRPMQLSSLMYIQKGKQHMCIALIRLFMMKILG
jgi:hypothetical protein